MPNANPVPGPEPVDKRRIWKAFKIAGIILMLVFVPTVRSCGLVASGIPFVALAQRNGNSIQVNWPNLALNLSIAAIIILIAAIGWRRLKRPETKETLRTGFDSVGIYALLVAIGYLAVYPLAVNANEHSFAGWFFIIYASFIHPYIWIMPKLSALFSGALSRSSLFGDDNDIPMRLGFILMCALWFGLGCAASAVSRRLKRKLGGEGIN